MSELAISNEEVFFKWSPDYSVDIKTIDNQHQELVSILNHLFIAVSKRQADREIAIILDDLIGYTKTHFSLEERLMQQAGYEDFEAHKLEHKKLLERLDQLTRKYLVEEKPIHFELLNFLKLWLKEHIKGSDKKYSSSLRKTGFSMVAWEQEATAAFKEMVEKTGRWWRMKLW
ncbi:bacteriohemerythrin [Sideroxydans lithotrophicus]|uniref:Hemerythrin-like metal-binding protein n=1 Tax=Sideroxydans lithotrophicus (strain ES-1) TaxID=580332 RepID=D5CPH0_SIDLE|nr:bacteriohemerythrin [Sideroxydans lithotrophicus]ADE11111.1 hemerythrin-like metal-binding protein [Sideroxydans lithotrophicus ES-1]